MQQAPLLLVLIDGWRHDWLDAELAPFLAAHAVARGSLVEPFGFATGPAIFAGLQPEQAGYSHKFHLDPQRSPWRFTRFIPSLLLRSGRVRRWIERRARRALDARGCTLPGSVWEFRHVPHALQRWFDLSEFHRSDAPGAFAVPGLFDRARAAGLPFVYLGPPETTLETAAALAACRERLEARHRLIHVHLGEPDWVAHREGPGSTAHRATLRQADQAVEQLVALVRERCGEPRLLAFGDHGFLPVERTVDVAAALDAAGLVAGRDHVMFLDSTTARFWFPCGDRARARVLAAVEALGLQRLDPQTLRAWRVEFAGGANWEECFLAPPGTVIHPDFFGGPGSPPVRGMHGYGPEVRDNHAAWALGGPGAAATADGLPEPLPLPDLFGLACRLLDLPGPPPREPGALGPRAQADLQRVRARLLKRMPDLEGLALFGAFARGEGTLLEGRPINDYDLLLVGPDTPARRELVRFGKSLAAELGVRHLDLVALTRAELASAGPRLFFVDLRAHGVVLHGDPGLLDAIPPHPPESVPREEARVLLFNRLTCPLECTSQAILDGDQTDPSRLFDHHYRTAKVVLCAAHARLVQHGAHTTTVRGCAETFARLFPGPEAELVRRAARFKLDPGASPPPGPWFEARDFYLQTIRRQLDLPPGDAPLVRFARTHCRYSLRDRLRLAFHRLTGQRRKHEENFAAHRRRAIESAELLLVAAPRENGRAVVLLLGEAASLLAPYVRLPGRDWESLRAAVVEADYRWLHPRDE